MDSNLCELDESMGQLSMDGSETFDVNMLSNHDFSTPTRTASNIQTSPAHHDSVRRKFKFRHPTEKDKECLIPPPPLADFDDFNISDWITPPPPEHLTDELDFTDLVTPPPPPQFADASSPIFPSNTPVPQVLPTPFPGSPISSPRPQFTNKSLGRSAAAARHDRSPLERNRSSSTISARGRTSTISGRAPLESIRASSTSSRGRSSSTISARGHPPLESIRSASTSATILPEPIRIPRKNFPKLDPEKGKRIYLATYVHADAIRFPTRKSFGKFIVSAFNSGPGKIKATHWAVCVEPHPETGDFHYHCSMSFPGTIKWKRPWEAMDANGVTVDFSDTHDYYISMYRYVTKDDPDVYLSPNHPDLAHIRSPRTKTCNAVNRSRRGQKRPAAATNTAATKQQKQQQREEEERRERRSWNNKLTKPQVSGWIIKKNLTTKIQMWAEAKRRRDQGECDLAEFMINISEKNLAELIEKSWLLENSEKILSEDSKDRLTRMAEALEQPCVTEDCRWSEHAKEVLRANRIKYKEFAGAIYGALKYGRQKFRNVFISGPSNTAKTWILKPLKLIFGKRLFENPARDKFGWGGIERCQVAVLNDFRYHKDMIAWNDFLLLLEGETVKLIMPKNHHANNLELQPEQDIPFFGTALNKIEYSKFSPDYEGETAMMDSRWKRFQFSVKYEGQKRKDIKPCARCFAEFVSGSQQ